MLTIGKDDDDDDDNNDREMKQQQKKKSKKLSRVHHLFSFSLKVICIVVVDINNAV